MKTLVFIVFAVAFIFVLKGVADLRVTQQEKREQCISAKGAWVENYGSTGYCLFNK
jgi:hypothetical protein